MSIDEKKVLLPEKSVIGMYKICKNHNSIHLFTYPVRPLLNF